MSHVSSHSTATANSPDGLSALHKKFGHANLGIYVVIFLALALCPLFLNNYWLLALNNIGLYAVLALSLNIVLGNTGLFNMGHMAFYAIGAYTTAILNTQFQVPVLWLMPISGLFAGIAALFVAWPVIRLRGDYLLIVTIAVVEIVCIALENDIFGITGGSNGIFGIDRPMLFGIKIFREWQFFYLIWGFLGLTMILFHLLEKSRFGRALNYIKQDETAAEGSGISTAHYKMMAFIFAAFWAGMAGTLYAAKMNTVSPGSFTFGESAMLFAIVILGGAGSIRGVLLATFVLIGLQTAFSDLKSARLLVFGAAMVAMMILRPQGILPPKPQKYKVDEYLTDLPEPAFSPKEQSAKEVKGI